MDTRIRKLLKAAMDKQGVPNADIEAIEDTAEFETAEQQLRLGASERVVIQLLERAVIESQREWA